MAGYALKLKETTAADITTGISIDNGSMLVEQDSARVSFDLNGNRVTIDGIIYLNTDAERTSLIAPISNKIYYVRATKKLWVYSESSWVCINGITASDIKTALGVSATGDAGKYLNEQGAFTEPSGSSGVGHSIFEIFYSLSSTTPPGAMDLSLGTLITSCNTLYPDFWEACMAQKTAGTIRCLTESAWQAELLSNGGSCGAFVIDDDTSSASYGSVRLPKIVDYLRGGTDAQIGTYLGDAIRNITGSAHQAYYATSGAIYGATNSGAYGPTTNSVWKLGNVTLDASRVVPTANENRPKTVYAKLYIQVYTAAVPASTVQAAEFVNTLEGKAGTSLEGLTTTGGNVIAEKAHNRIWTSSAQTLAANNYLILTHNLNLPIGASGCPTSARWDMIAKCTTAENGFSAGDVVTGLTGLRYVNSTHYWGDLSGVVFTNQIFVWIPDSVRTWRSLLVSMTFTKWQFYVRIFY